MLFIIQVHEKADQVILILELLAGKDTAFIINIDPNSNIDVDVIDKYIQSREISAILRRGSIVTWGGISQVLSWLDVLSFALSMSNWKFVVNLSGSCLPLATSEAILGFLSDHMIRGITTHISYFGDPVPVMDAQYHCIQIGKETGYNLTSSDVRIIDRVDSVMQNDLTQTFKNHQLDPVHNWHLRGTIHVSDLSARKLLSVRRLFPHEIVQRRKFAKNHILHGGRAWFAMERAQVSLLINSDFTIDLLSHLNNYFCSDELFLQTFFMNEPKVDKTTIRKRNLHYKAGDPIEINESMGDDIMSSPAMFVRKFDLKRDVKLVSKVKTRSKKV